MRGLIFTTLVLALAGPAIGQEHAQATSAAVDLPPICLENAAQQEEPMPMGHGGGAGEAHQALMAGMDQMNREMEAGGTATDIDVAFVCSMIPHHRGAIDMAKAELQFGDDPWARKMAEQVIAAQEQEIADMLAWLDEQSN
jgi:uncharacterized protein (DUF305 family)